MFASLQGTRSWKISCFREVTRMATFKRKKDVQTVFENENQEWAAIRGSCAGFEGGDATPLLLHPWIPGPLDGEGPHECHKRRPETTARGRHV